MAEILRKLDKFFREIWRRRVLHVAIPYGVAGWLLVQIAEIVLEAFQAPPWVMQSLLGLLLLGFPVAIVLAWIFDITPMGSVVRTPAEDAENRQASRPPPALSLEMGDSERRQITILSCAYEFSDSLKSETDPEYLQSCFSVLQAISRRIAERYDGFSMPGGLQGFSLAFGYPHAREDDARRAVAAGLALIEDVENSSDLKSIGQAAGFTARVGIATGLVVVEESGPDGKDVAIIGHVPRFASWLMSLAQPGSVVVGPQTRMLVKTRFQLEPRGTHSQPQYGGEITVYGVGAARSSEDFFAETQQITGREDEMSLLEDRWRNVCDGDSQVVLLRGEAGIGKSSLVNAFYRWVIGNDGAVVIPCQCSPYERHNPLSPLIHVLQGPILRFTDLDSSESRLQKLIAFMESQSVDTDQAVPLLANLLSLDTGKEFAQPSVSAQVVRLQTLELLLDMIGIASAKRPVLMILEDLHWADPTTLEMVQMLMDRGSFPGLFVLLSARPEFSADWTRRSFVLVHELPPLGRHSARDLIAATRGAEEFPDALVDRIISETDGNPLYIQELTRAVLESSAWRSSRDKGMPGEMTGLKIPSTLQDSLAARVDNLGDTKTLLQLCSVLGREFSYDLLRLVSGTENEAALKEELSRLVKAEMLFQRGLFRNLTYTFKHILIQETAYNSLLKSKRRELHLRTAQILEQKTPDVARRQPALLAHHFTEARDLEKAIAYWIQAGRQSLAQFANPEAVAQMHTAIKLVKSAQESPRGAALEITLQSILGTALLSTHGYAHSEVRKVFTRALELCELVGDAPQLFHVAVGLWMYHTIASRLDEALDLSQRLVRISENSRDPVQFLQARYCLAFVLYYRGEFLAAQTHLDDALNSENDECDYSTQSPTGDDTRIHVRVILAHVNWHLGDSTSGEQLLLEADAIARERNHPWGLVFASFQSAWFHQMRGEPAKTLEYAAEAARIANEKGFGFWLPLLNLIGAWAESRQSETRLEPQDAGGVTRMKSALERYRAMGSGAGVSCSLFMLAEDYIALGRRAEAEEQLENARSFQLETGEYFFEPEYYRLHGRIHLEKFRETGQTEELDKASVYFKQALAKAQRYESRALELRAAPYRAEALAIQGQHELAVRLLTGITQRASKSRGSRDWDQANETLIQLGNNSN